MQIRPTRLAGARLIEPTVHGDDRGFFLESFRADALITEGIDVNFVQDNHSRSRRGVTRGMHFQPGQCKLVRCARGAIFDVIVDLRPWSPTRGHWEGFELDDETHRQLLIPDGFAHGFCVLTDLADVTYKVSEYYDPRRESGFRYDDPDVNIDWPLSAQDLVVSKRDLAAPTLAELTVIHSSSPASSS